MDNHSVCTFEYVATLMVATVMGPDRKVVGLAHTMQDALSDAYNIARDQGAEVLRETVVKNCNIIVYDKVFICA